MIHQPALNEVRSARQKRVLGCVGWAAILAFFASVALLIIANIITAYEENVSFSFLSGDSLAATLLWFFIFFVPGSFLAIIVGIYSKPKSHFFLSTGIIVPFVTGLYTLFIYFLYLLPLGSRHKPSQETFWNPWSFGLSAVISGVILGIIASVGYWHAGRSQKRMNNI